MDKQVMFSFLTKLVRESYGDTEISIRFKVANKVIAGKTSFKYKNFEMSKDKQEITLYDNNDSYFTIRPQDLLTGSMEDEYYLFNTNGIDMEVAFV